MRRSHCLSAQCPCKAVFAAARTGARHSHGWLPDKWDPVADVDARTAWMDDIVKQAQADGITQVSWRLRMRMQLQRLVCGWWASQEAGLTL